MEVTISIESGTQDTQVQSSLEPRGKSSSRVRILRTDISSSSQAVHLEKFLEEFAMNEMNNFQDQKQKDDYKKRKDQLIGDLMNHLRQRKELLHVIEAGQKVLLVVAHQSGLPVGFSYAVLNNSKEVSQFYVGIAHDFQRHGIGTTLFALQCSELHQRGYESILTGTRKGSEAGIRASGLRYAKIQTGRHAETRIFLDPSRIQNLLGNLNPSRTTHTARIH